MAKAIKIPVTCNKCGKEYWKERNAAQKWNGLCRRCSIAVNNPFNRIVVDGRPKASGIGGGR